MKSNISTSLQAIRLEDGHAHYMGDRCWVLERYEEIDGLTHRHTFAITEDDRRALLSSLGGALLIPLEDGEAHKMGDGCFVLTRSEPQDGDEVHHAIGVTMGDLERLAA